MTGTKTTPKYLIDENPGTFPYVTTKSSNNGIQSYSSIKTEKGGVLVVDSAVSGFMTYQEEDFSASDHVEKLIPLFNMSKLVALFKCTVWNCTYAGIKYTYANKASQTAIKEESIKLPILDSDLIDIDYMESMIRNSTFGKLLK